MAAVAWFSGFSKGRGPTGLNRERGEDG